MRLYETAAKRAERLRGDIVSAHADMARLENVVGALARLYDKLHEAVDAGRAPGFTASSHTDVTRKRAMFTGGIAFTGKNISGQEVKVDIRRTTTCMAKGPGYADLSVFRDTNKGQERVRVLLSTHYNGTGVWRTEATVGGDNTGYMSRKALEFEKPEVLGVLVRDVALLAMGVCPDFSGQPRLPAASTEGSVVLGGPVILGEVSEG